MKKILTRRTGKMKKKSTYRLKRKFYAASKQAEFSNRLLSYRMCAYRSL